MFALRASEFSPCHSNLVSICFFIILCQPYILASLEWMDRVLSIFDLNSFFSLHHSIFDFCLVFTQAISLNYVLTLWYWHATVKTYNSSIGNHNYDGSVNWCGDGTPKKQLLNNNSISIYLLVLLIFFTVSCSIYSLHC